MMCGGTRRYIHTGVLMASKLKDWKWGGQPFSRLRNCEQQNIDRKDWNVMRFAGG